MGEKRKKQIQWVVFFISIFVVMGILMWDSLARIKREGTYYYKENMTEEELAKVKELADKVKSGETKVVDQLTDATAYDTYLEMTAK